MRNVKIISDGTGCNTSIVDLDTDKPIKGIVSIDVSIRVKKPNLASAVFYLEKADIAGEMCLLAPHPVTGAMTEVKAIEFASGERVEF